MVNYKDIINNNIFPYIIIFLLSIFISIAIIGIIDKKLGEISINIPKQNIIIKINKDDITMADEIHEYKPNIIKQHITETFDNKPSQNSKYQNDTNENADTKNENADTKNENANAKNENADTKNENANAKNENADTKNKNIKNEIKNIKNNSKEDKNEKNKNIKNEIKNIKNNSKEDKNEKNNSKEDKNEKNNNKEDKNEKNNYTFTKYNNYLKSDIYEINEHDYINGYNKNIKYMPGCETSKDCNIFQWNNNENICINNKCVCKNGSGAFCQYGPTNFPNPKDMSNAEIQIFKISYPPNMTLQDYVNWLWLYKNEKHLLTEDHLANIMKLENGILLKYEYGITPPPSKKSPPYNSEDYFKKLYNIDKINLASPLMSTTDAIIGYNYNDYPDFKNNNAQYGLSGHVSNTDDIWKK